MMKNILTLAVVGSTIGISGFANTTGSPLIQRQLSDTCVGCVFAYIPITDIGETLISWRFYADQIIRPNSLITPLLFENTGGSNFKVVGVGQTQSVINNGINAFTFGLQSGGTALIGSNYWFGWRDGGTTGSGNEGNISLTQNPGPGPGIFYFQDGNYTYTGTTNVNQSFAMINTFTESRTYSVEATTTPEPGFYAALAIGLSGLAFARRRSVKS